jgi:cyclophilin family peptidyl-prolyl cis-trans isomerase
VPSEKRARQRALRNQKMAVVARQRRRNRALRRAASGVVVLGLVVGLVVLLSSHSTKPKKAASKTTESAIAPTCPPATGSAKRVVSFSKAPPVCISQSATYEATVATDVGTFVVKMPAAASLLGVNNFVFLSRYHFYDSTVFQRVIPGFVVQGGDPTGTGKGGPGYSFTGNTPKARCTGHCYPLGALVYANSNSSPSTDESQFFIVAGSLGEQLPPDYTMIGQVVSGMPTVLHIAADGNSDDNDNGVPPKVLHHIVKVTITEVAS